VIVVVDVVDITIAITVVDSIGVGVDVVIVVDMADGVSMMSINWNVTFFLV
jgi:UPF0716 family protein affecting phage T7 exclusion